jgi:hypothetical protein
MSESEYVMGSGGPELARLVQQAHLFEAESRALLQNADLRPGMKAVDVGCGPVGVLDGAGRG